MSYPTIESYYVSKNPWTAGGKWLVLADYGDATQSAGPGNPGYRTRREAERVAAERNAAMWEMRESRL